jgi:hypothetical protein
MKSTPGMSLESIEAVHRINRRRKDDTKNLSLST